jgi:hypothetical protein
MTDLRSVPDEIGWGDDREPRRLPGWMSPGRLRRRTPRWVTPVVVSLAVVLAAGAVVVPRVAAHFAGGTAARVLTAWREQTELDTLRIAAVDDVESRVGLVDSLVVEQAVRHADGLAIAALGRIRDRLDDGRSWRGDVAAARAAVFAAIDRHVRLLDADRTSTSPDGGFLYDSEYGALTERADRLVAALLRRYHLTDPELRGFRLPPLTAELELVSRPVDARTGLRLVVGDRGTLTSFDLDTGTATRLLHVGSRPVLATLPDGQGVVRGNAESISVFRPGGVRDRTGPFAYPQVLGWSPDGFWVSEGDRVQWYDATGRRVGAWYEIPVGSGFVTAGAGDTLVLQDVTRLSAWNPRSGRLTPLGDFCPIATAAAAAGLAVVIDCGRHAAVRVYDTPTGRLTARYPLPPHANRWDLRLAPDGRTLAFGRTNVGSRFQLMDVATGDVTTVAARIPVSPVTWSPDGRWLLVVRADETAGRQTDTYALWDRRAGRLYSVRLALDPSYDAPATLLPVRP